MSDSSPSWAIFFLFPLLGIFPLFQPDPGNQGGHPWFRPELTEKDAIAAFEEFITQPKNNLLPHCEYKKSHGRKKKSRTRILEIIYEEGSALVRIEYRMTCSTLRYKLPDASVKTETGSTSETDEETLIPGVEGQTTEETTVRETFVFVWKNEKWVIDKKLKNPDED